MMGKRTDHAGRTVLGPGIDLRVDESGLLKEMAARLSYPDKCTAYNLSEMQAYYDNDKIRFIELQIAPKTLGPKTIVSEKFRRDHPDFQLKIGDVIHRPIKNGDIAMLNRQPSLHKESFLALYVKIHEDKNMKMNLSITTPLNADFDGDEGNVHMPQTYEARIEAEQLASAAANLMSGENNKSMMYIVYDSLLAAYLLTRDMELLNQLHKIDVEDVTYETGYYKKRNEIEEKNIEGVSEKDQEKVKNNMLEKLSNEHSKHISSRVEQRKKLVNEHKLKKKNYDKRIQSYFEKNR